MYVHGMSPIIWNGFEYTAVTKHIDIETIWVSALGYLFSESAQFPNMVCARSSYIYYILIRLLASS